MNDIHNNENISQEEEFVSPGQEKVNGKATPEQSGPSTGEPREQPGEPTEEAVEIEETEEIEIIEAGEFTVPKKEEEEEEIQELHTKHPRRDVPVIDHRLLAGKLTVYDWLEDLPATDCAPEIVEVRFKNTRKGFYSNPSKLALKAGDIVAVEAALGHDIGVVSLSGELVKEQIRIKRVDLERNPLKKVYRKAKPHDIEKWQQAIALEHDTMIRSRKIAADLKLNMKIGDVEYQGDKTKAIFYYIADDRVDFRTLIKVLAETFHIRIEMKQIGTRQEAGRIGGIGPCGRKLCCSTFITNFISVSTSAARYQDISMNPQKLAGQCAKLKCCINYEVDAYVEAQKRLPSREVVLETKDNTYYHFKMDIFKREITYSTDKSFAANLITISANRAFDVINMNKKGMKPVTLEADTKPQPPKRDAQDILGQDSVTRFDASLKKKKKKRNGNGNKENLPKEAAANTGNEGNSKPSNGEKANGNTGNENKNGKGNGNRNGNRNRNSGNRENNRERENRENNRNRPRPNRVNNDKQPNNDKPQQQAKPAAKPESKPDTKPEA